MAILRIENVPRHLYARLLARARSNRRSTSAEVLSLLQQSLQAVEEPRSRAVFYERVMKIRRRLKPAVPGRAVEDLLRRDRMR